MYAECDICCNTTIIIPCGANNNCSVVVCKPCFIECDYNYNFTCVFCKCIDNRRSLIRYVDYICNEEGGDDYTGKSYVECKMWILKNKDLVQDFTNDEWRQISYCFDCEE
jgi:hypothetical protein